MIPPAWSRREALVLLLLAGVLGTQVGLVRSTNFYGYDEWTILYLLAHRIIDIPYANRPLELLWALPAAWFDSNSFLPWAALHWGYALLMGFLVFRLCACLAPAEPLLGFLAGCFAIVWAPTDFARLSYVERMLYGGISFGMLLAVVVFLESFARRSHVLLALSCLLCVISGRCYEATLPVFLVAPVLLFALEGRASRACWEWTLVWGGFVAFALLLALQPKLFPSADPSYQALFGLDLQPRAVLTRLALQYWLHLSPLVVTPLAELHVAAAGIAALVFAAAAAFWARLARPSAGQAPVRLDLLMAAGLILAGAGYGALSLTPQGFQPWRMQFLSAPGIALFLAAGISRLGALAKRFAPLVVVLAASWVMAVGSARTVAMQKAFDSRSLYGPQIWMLSQLVEAVPDVKPDTLIVLLDDVGVWRADFGFRHAVELLYRGRAIGYVHGVWAAMFPTSFDARGVRCEPWPSIRSAWRAAPTRHAYGQVVVVRFTRQASVAVLDDWPSELPGLPADAGYAPRSRIVPLGDAIPQRRALTSLEGG